MSPDSAESQKQTYRYRIQLSSIKILISYNFCFPKLSILARTLEGHKNLSTPTELSAEGERELVLAEKKIQAVHVDQVDPKLNCILVILLSRQSSSGILVQREDIILEWIFPPQKQNKRLKTYVKKI